MENCGAIKCWGAHSELTPDYWRLIVGSQADRLCLKSQNSTNAVGGLLIRCLLSRVTANFWESHRPQSVDGPYLTWKEVFVLENSVKLLSWRCRSDMNNPPTALVEFDARIASRSTPNALVRPLATSVLTRPFDPFARRAR
jgi:hypothetical protein